MRISEVVIFSRSGTGCSVTVFHVISTRTGSHKDDNKHTQMQLAQFDPSLRALTFHAGDSNPELPCHLTCC